MARTFSMDTSVAPSSLLAKKVAVENGAILVGNEGPGRFSHELVKGEYRAMAQTVVVTITEKHWLLPWPVVEVRLRELATESSLSGGLRGGADRAVVATDSVSVNAAEVKFGFCPFC
jgi:hypothetical protein